MRSDHLPLTALLHKRVGPDKFSADKILFCLLRFDGALTDDDARVTIKARLQVVNLELGENGVAGHAFQIGSLVHDPAIRPDNRAIFSLEPTRV